MQSLKNRMDVVRFLSCGVPGIQRCVYILFLSFLPFYGNIFVGLMKCGMLLTLACGITAL